MAMNLSNQEYQPVNIGQGFSEAFARGASAVPDLGARVNELLATTMQQRGASERSAMDAQAGIDKTMLSEQGAMNRDTNKLNLLAAGMGLGAGGNMGSATMQKMRSEKVYEMMDIVKQNQVKKKNILDAMTALKDLPQGAMGAGKIQAMKWFKPGDPILAKWQNLKSVLTDNTLMKLASYKGAISNYELNFFREAAANDDMVSVSRMGDALNRLVGFIDADEQAKRESFKLAFGEDFPVVGAGPGLPAPEGVAEEDWNAASPTQKQQYIDWLLGGKE